MLGVGRTALKMAQNQSIASRAVGIDYRDQAEHFFGERTRRASEQRRSEHDG